MFLLLGLGAVTATLSGGCVGVSQKRGVAGNGAGAALISEDYAAAAASGVKVCPGGVRDVDDGLVDDLEDGNNQLAGQEGRDGYWWTKKDDVGSTAEMQPEGPGAEKSETAMHLHGKTANGDPSTAWGAGFGFNFTDGGKLYDASKYAGISFRAKAGPMSTHNVRFNIGDVNTHKDGGICKTCWNHFGKDIVLTGGWREYKVTFAGAEQQPYWGDPRPPSISPAKLLSVDWSIGPGQVYDIWVDDIRLLECQP